MGFSRFSEKEFEFEKNKKKRLITFLKKVFLKFCLKVQKGFHQNFVKLGETQGTFRLRKITATIWWSPKKMIFSSFLISRQYKTNLE